MRRTQSAEFPGSSPGAGTPHINEHQAVTDDSPALSAATRQLGVDAAEFTTKRTRSPTVRARRSRGRRRAKQFDAAARLRRRVQERGSAWCDWCLADFPADGVDVDHVRPLSLDGEDMDSNVQVAVPRPPWAEGAYGVRGRRSP
ncbi:hypothetical protein GCM10010331_12910 [Streptomyces xanthochromogenes]|nr:hypothetical protein GCM10010331_12910 [Streptomyces xanthochromogenes]